MLAPADGRGAAQRGRGVPAGTLRHRGIPPRPGERPGRAGRPARRGNRRASRDARAAPRPRARAPGTRARILLQGRGQPRPPALRAGAGRGRAGRGQGNVQGFSSRASGPAGAGPRTWGASIAPDSNITGASEPGDHPHRAGRRRAAFERNPDEVETSGVGVQIWTGGEYQHPIGNRLRLRAGVDAFRRSTRRGGSTR